MRFDDIEINDVNLVTVHGDMVSDEFNRVLVDHVRARLMDGHLHFVLDLSAVRAVDSRGLGELIECYGAATRLGGMVKLLGVNSRLADLLVITKLVNVFECFDTRDEAIASFSPALVAVAR